MNKKIAGYLCYIVPGLTFLVLVCLNIFVHDHWLDSDMAAEMLFSKLLAEDGRFFATKGWYYSTEFRFLYTHWIMTPLFHILRRWHVIRAVTNILSYALLVAAYVYCMKPLGVKKTTVALTSTILLLPFSETMMTHMVMGNTYPFHVIIVFLFVGLFQRLAGGKAGKGTRLFWLVCYLALAVVCGVSGVRYLLALQVPLAAAAFAYLLKTPEFAQIRRELKPENLRSVWKPLLVCGAEGAEGSGDAVRYVGWSLAGLAGSLAGYAVNMLYVSRQYVFQTYDATKFIAVYQGRFTERVQNAFGSLIMLFGYIPEREVISLRGVVTVISFVLLALFGYCAVWACKRCREGRLFMALFLAMSFLINVFAFVFTDSTMVPRYYITTIVFVLPVLCFYLEQEEIYFDRLAVTAALVVCLFIASGKTVLSYLGTDKNAPKRAVAEFLREKGYTFGYATYWNANIVSELTDGKVEIANLWNVPELEYFKWSSPAKYYEKGYHTGEVFLLLTAEEAAAAAGTQLLEQGRVIYEDESYVALLYGSAETMFDLAEKLPLTERD